MSEVDEQKEEAKGGEELGEWSLVGG